MQSFDKHQRQVHLDFHTSPHIHDVAVNFDADAFAQTFKDAHVNSVTLFAKCHHGMSYYPTKAGTVHPTLNGRDLLGEQLEALHRVGIRAPIYTPVGWEEDVAHRFPEWRQIRADGTFARVGNADLSKPPQPGGWWFNNFVHPDYLDYIEAHLRELFANYDVDGIFFDIVFMDPAACWSEASLRFREKHGLMSRDSATQSKFETAAQVQFAERFTKLIHGLKPSASVFYNSTNPLCANSRYGVRSRHELQTHWELESLPSGFWGYHHFPRLARAFGQWGKPWLGMTGRFQRMWGDFGGLKPAPALEYECFRTQALGGANSVGDQLPPRGQLDAGAYRLIGQVYAQCAAAEPFYAGSQSMPQVGVVAPGDPSQPSSKTDQSLEGAIQMCEEAHYDCVVLDDASEFDATALDLIILPDSVVFTPALKQKITAYLANGGRLIASHYSGFLNEDGAVANDSACMVLPLQLTGECSTTPSYWRVDHAFNADLALSDRVVYERGLNVEANANATALGSRVLPYFQRSDLKFCSHFQAPPRAEPDAFPAIVAGEHFVYFADPIFREYRADGNIAVRDAWLSAMERLIGRPPVGHGLPKTMLCVPRHRGENLLITLLHYIPTRKALSVDMIEERSSFAGEILQLPEKFTQVIDFETGKPLPAIGKGTFSLPSKKGRLLLKATKRV